MSAAVLSRDDLYKLISQDDFFTCNPAFAALQAAVAQCRAAYDESAKKSTCGCGGATALVLPCLDAALDLAEQLKTDDPAAIQTLITYLGEKRADPTITTFTIYYRKSSSIPLRKIKFP
jgi:hypothetical protein